ncbi:hypothetical protein MLD38_000899 [Melastoma candidum]|uniref:Uncharacterized protein n=1 Tax=Melastoma candidum TaxID=119954 RepID=A0ACB9SBK2_9MYRT|nr:hypothetical protein MLD38_000899 [Melastoma candidum]
MGKTFMLGQYASGQSATVMSYCRRSENQGSCKSPCSSSSGNWYSHILIRIVAQHQSRARWVAVTSQVAIVLLNPDG